MFVIMKKINPFTVRRAIMTAALPALLLFLSCNGEKSTTTVDTSSDAGIVKLLVELPSEEGIQESYEIQGKALVLDVMTGLKNEKKLSFEISGNGDMAFVTEMAGIPNEGKDGKNWIYAINGKAADTGIGSAHVRPGDEVRWCFLKSGESSTGCEHPSDPSGNHQ